MKVIKATAKSSEELKKDTAMLEKLLDTEKEIRIHRILIKEVCSIKEQTRTG